MLVWSYERGLNEVELKLNYFCIVLGYYRKSEEPENRDAFIES